ncbi:YfhO family protein [Vibrio aestuarianus]|nr:YfhO family protein [Vibrio aestuarianus]
MKSPWWEGIGFIMRHININFFLSFFLYLFIYLFVFYGVVSNEVIFKSDGQLPHFFKDLSIWDSSWSSGYYILADSASFNLYPLRLFFNTFFPKILGFNLFVISSYILASFFVYLYTYKLTNNNYSSFLGGLFFGLCGFMIGHLGHTSMIHTAIWLPLGLYAIERLKDKFYSYHVFLLSISILMMVLAGHLQIVLYSLIILLSYSLFTRSSFQNLELTNLRIFLIFLFSLLLSTFQLVPTFEMSQSSMRQDMSFEIFNETIHSVNSLILLFFPWIYGNEYYDGVKYFGPWYESEMTLYMPILCFYLMAAMLFLGKLDKVMRFWVVILFVSLLASMGSNIYTLSEILYQIPVLNKFRALARHSFEFSLSVSILSAFIINRLINNEVLSKFRYFIVCIIVSLLVLFYLYFTQVADFENAYSFRDVIRELIFNKAVYSVMVIHFFSILAIAFLVMRPGWFSKFILFITAFFSLLYLVLSSYGLNDTYSGSILEPRENLHFILDNINEHERILEMDGVLTPLLSPDISTLYGIDSAGWYGPLLNREYSECLSMESHGYLNPSFINKSGIINMLNIRYLLVSDFSLMSEDIRLYNDNLLFNGQYWNTHVFENKSAFGKAWIVRELSYYPSNEICDYISSNEIVNLNIQAYTDERKFVSFIEGFDLDYSLSLVSFSNGYFKFHVDIESGGYLILSERYNKGWNVRVNGKPSEVIKINSIIQGVKISKDTNSVEFYFLPNSLIYSIFISIFTFVVFIFYTIVKYKRRIS